MDVASGNTNLGGGNLDTGGGNINAGNINGAIITGIIKNFDIEHPSKKEPWRLRYSVLEGPEIGVYVRGRLKDTNVIEMPPYWVDLVHEDSITVLLTPIGNSSVYFVEKIEGNRVFIGSNNEYIDLYYTVFAERKDTDKLVIEYKRES
jgi:hypothetical protein